MRSHCCAANNPATVARDVHKSLKNLMRVCKPGKSVIIAFDGPAPLAKIVEQRYEPALKVQDLDLSREQGWSQPTSCCPHCT